MTWIEQNSEADAFEQMDYALEQGVNFFDTAEMNETPWGVMSFLHAAEQLGLPRIISVQNPYNLLNRSYEIGLSEIS